MKLGVTGKKTDRITDPQTALKDRIQGIIEQSRKIMVVSHIDPDGDSLGTQLAFGAYLKNLGKEVYMVRESDIPQKYAFLPDIDRIRPDSELSEHLAVDTAIVLECPSLERIGSPARFLHKETTIVSIDHHPDGDDLGHVNWNDSAVSSVGEMVYEFFEHVGYAISPAVAEQLFTALLTDTGRFRYSSTSPRTMTIAGQLIEAGADPNRICNEVYYNLPASTLRLIGKVLNTLEFFHDDKFCVLTLTKKMLEEAGAAPSESDGIVDFTLYGHGVQAGVLLKEIDNNRTKISLRSSEAVNVGAVAAAYNGGGHFNAAGCTMSLPLDKARAEIIRRLAEATDAGK